MTRILRVALATSLLLLFAVPAFAATLNGVTPVSPKSGAKVKTGVPPTFKAKAVGGGTVWVHVCKSKKKDAEGVICSTAVIAQMKKKSGVYRHKPIDYSFPSYWLNRPGTYYWQVHRIQCENGDTSDCRQEGPIVKFRVG
jgi:hypothetical protein